MRCLSPLQAYQFGSNPETGKPFVKVVKKGTELTHLAPDARRLDLPCGQCIECRLARSRVWAVRCLHEAQLHDENYFITLTYNEENLPKTDKHGCVVGDTLRPDHLTNFFKRVRKYRQFRYYACGEYGDVTTRPHYHFISFGLPLNDLQFYKNTASGPLFTSEWLERKWTHGFVTVGHVSFESAAYVARYVLKKQTGKHAHRAYDTIDKSTGELIQERMPEFTRMSRRPGIGHDFYKKFGTDIYQAGTDGVVYLRGGIPTKTPSYYDKLFEMDNPERMAEIKERRIMEAEKRGREDLTELRIEARKKLINHRTKKLIRNLE